MFSWYTVSVGIHSDAMFSWNLLSRSAPQAITYYMLVKREKSAWHTNICSPHTLVKAEFSRWRSSLILIWASAQLMPMNGFRDALKLQRYDSPGGEELLGKAEPILLCLPPQLSSVTYSPLTIFSTSLCCHRGGSIHPWGKKTFGYMQFFSHSCQEWVYYIEGTGQWSWQRLMISSTLFCPEGGSPLSLWLVIYIWDWGVGGHERKLCVSPPAAKTTQCLLTLGRFLASERLLSGVRTLFS